VRLGDWDGSGNIPRPKRGREPVNGGGTALDRFGISSLISSLNRLATLPVNELFPAIVNEVCRFSAQNRNLNRSQSDAAPAGSQSFLGTRKTNGLNLSVSSKRVPSAA
jgi:hypothetical protein